MKSEIKHRSTMKASGIAGVMDSRRNAPPAYDEHSRPYDEHTKRTPESVHPDAIHPREPHHPRLLEDKFISQEAEIERLAKDNHVLSSCNLALRQDIVAAQKEVDNLREYMRSIQTEADIQIRIYLDKAAKLEAHIRSRESIKKELQDAHIEAQRLETSRQELNAQIEQATKELEKSCEDLKTISALHAELDNLTEEHKKLRETFEHEKGLNEAKVEQLKILEKDLIGKAEEVERLRAQVPNTRHRASVPDNSPHTDSENYSPPPLLRNGCYSNGSAQPHLIAVDSTASMQRIDLYPNDEFSITPPLSETGPVATSAAGNSWGGMYGMPHTQV